MELLISNQQDQTPVSQELLDFCQQVAQKAWPLISTHEGQISIALVDNATIQELNRVYRSQDKVTDVLSFPFLGEVELVPFGQELIGEIVISLPKAREQSRDYGHSLERELAFLLVHGLLHLAGYDHDDENRGLMRQKEKEILARLGISR